MSKFVCVVIFLTTIVFSGNCYNTIKKCVQENSCLCRLDEYRIINISSVLNTNYLEDTYGNITYYFLGCEDNNFVLPNKTKIKASLIKYYASPNATDKKSNFTIIGKASSLKFEFASNTNHKDYQLVYNETENSTTPPTIQLICDSFKNRL
ncbi:hypothetical protein NQ314_001014 [Rhamnusium bicolor]|uniref:Uncharacterized protein n=1 Tax=Rhamnusium bicolor TaxID=1586634 RepID=A0AAV8ZTV8_9CUCU|nr:hypothetical protein NQ314_001014 [Rhamnusium bicolor]